MLMTLVLVNADDAVFAQVRAKALSPAGWRRPCGKEPKALPVAPGLD